MKQKVFSLFLALVMMASVSLLSTSPVQAAEGAGTATITSMDYFSAADGPVITKSGLDKPVTDL